MTFKSKDVEFLSRDCYKCNRCGFERVIQPGSYQEQSRCSFDCDGQMMGWGWNGWKDNPMRQRYYEAQRVVRDIEGELTVSQESQPLDTFTEKERTIGKGLCIVDSLPFQAPWMSALGACNVNIFGIRRRGHLVEFGVGNEKPPILDWITANDFPTEWSK
jgi:hypothetical protein